MKTAFVTLANKKYEKALRVLTYSLKVNAPDFWNKVDNRILLTPDIDSYDGYDVVKVNPKDYPFWGNPKYAVACCKLHLFSFTEYDRIVFYEADTLCLSNHVSAMVKSTLFNMFDFYSVVDYNLGTEPQRKVQGKYPAIIGDGWIVNKKLLDGKFYDKVIELSKNCGVGFKMADQDAITILLNDNEISRGELVPELDFLRVIPDRSMDLYDDYKADIKMVHYVGKNKPFLFDEELESMPDRIENPLDRIWFEHYFSSRQK